MRDTERVVDAEQSTLQLIMEQVEELVVTLIEEIRERPGIAAAILAAIVGAFIGSKLAARTPGRKLPKGRPPKPVRRAGDMASVAGVAVRLLENPLVRGVIFGQVKRLIT